MTTRHIVSLLLFFATASHSATSDIWTPTGGPAETRVASVIVASNGNLFAGTLGAGIFRSVDNGTSWTPVNTGLSELDIHTLTADAGNRIYAGTATGLVYYSDNLGDSWALTSSTGINDIYAVGFTPAGQLFASGTGGICRSTDTGSSWDLLDVGMPQIMIWSATLILDETTLLTGSLGMGAIRSTDAGTTWAQIFPGPPDNIIYSFLKTANGEIFAGTGMGLFKSADDGINWVSLQNPENSNISSFAITPTGDYLAVTDAGVYASSNEGAVWSDAHSGLGDLQITGLAVSGGTIFAGTDGGGVYMSQSVTSVEPLNGIPSSFSLKQNYPNPFNPSTEIGFLISDFGFVSLRIYDLLGREVAVLVHETLPPGSYTRQWNADGLPSGIYVSRLQSGPLTQTRKMVLSK